MKSFNYQNFKLALKEIELKKEQELKEDIAAVKNFIEKTLTLALECTANKARAEYNVIDC